jgi:tetratricopeptide (TPR) repeat protein
LADLSPLDLALQYKVANGKIGVGDDLVKTGDRDPALSYYEAARQILDHIATKSTDRTARYELAICYSRIGDVYLFDAKPLSALSAYSKDLALTEPLAAADLKDSSLRAKLVGSKSSAAEAMVRAGRAKSGRTELQTSLNMAQALVASANNSLTQSYLAAVEMWIGEADEQSGDLPRASDSYRRALHRFSEMSAADPKDLDDAVNVVEARNHLAGARLQAGDTNEAAAEYQQALALAEALASANPENMAVVYAVADSQAGLGDLSVAMARKGSSPSSKRASWSHAQSSYQESLRAWGQINNPSRIAPNGFWASDPHQIIRRLDLCNAELKRIDQVSSSPVSTALHEH